MNFIDRINTVDDFDVLIRQARLAVVTSYRGNWCPFCRKYLAELNQARKNFPNNVLLVGISVDTVDECRNLQRTLGLSFDLISDEKLIMRELLNVNTGKGHGKEAYLQPSVFIFRDGDKMFQWIQEPKLMNLGGAIDRFPVSKVTQQVAEIASNSGSKL
jgi:peroxiredoxin